jgi:flavin-dependent dehydrogenase
MTKKDIHVYGAGLAGLTAAINLVRNEYNVTVYEKENRIGGSTKCHPSNHMTPMHIQKIQEYIGIKIEPCFSKLDAFRGYIGSKKYVFSTKNLHVVERGPRKTSLDYFLCNIAQEEGVNFKFSQPLTKEKLKYISENSIIATAGYSQLVSSLNLPYITFKQFDTHMKTDIGNSTIAYFGDYTSDYGYISGKNGIISAQLSGSSNLSQENLRKFTNLVKETEGIELDGWSSIVSHFPKKVQLFTKFAGKTFVLAGDVASFLDPFFGFGINGALISGKIAAISITSKIKAEKEFRQFTLHLNKNLLLHTIYRHLPFKNLIRSKVMKYQGKHLFPVKRSIPGFTDEDWLKIVSTEY